MSKSILPVYFFPGPELARKRIRMKVLCDAITKDTGTKPEVHKFYPYETEMSEVISLLQNGSLFSSFRMVVVADAHAMKIVDTKIFQEYFENPSKEAVLVFTTELSPGTRDYPRSLADMLPGKAVEVFWEMFERDRRGWVAHFFREKGFAVDKDTIDVLLDVTEGTTDALREACEQLIFALSDRKTVCMADVDRILEHSREETAYTLFDRFCQRDLAAALNAYRKIILSEPNAGDRLTSMLEEPLRRLRDFAVLFKGGVPAEEVARDLKIRGGKRALKAYKTGAGKFSNSELDKANASLIELETWLREAGHALRDIRIELWLCNTIGSGEASF